MLSTLSHPPTEFIRLVRAFLLERREIHVVGVHAAVMAIASLAVPIAAQALVNTISGNMMVQPIFMLSIMLLQFIVVDRVHRWLWVRGVSDWIRRTSRISRTSRQKISNRELCNRDMDMPILQKDFWSLLLDGTSLVMVLLAFYHPILLAFDAVLIVGIALVMIAGRGAERCAVIESHTKWSLFCWIV